jgi:hypothetical protein
LRSSVASARKRITPWKSRRGRTDAWKVPGNLSKPPRDLSTLDRKPSTLLPKASGHRGNLWKLRPTPSGSARNLCKPLPSVSKLIGSLWKVPWEVSAFLRSAWKLERQRSKVESHARERLVEALETNLEAAETSPDGSKSLVETFSLTLEAFGGSFQGFPPVPEAVRASLEAFGATLEGFPAAGERFAVGCYRRTPAHLAASRTTR